VAKKMICTWQGRQTRTETKAKLYDAAGGTRNVALYFDTANKEFVTKIKKIFKKYIQHLKKNKKKGELLGKN